MAGRPLIIDTDSGYEFAQALMLIEGCGLFDIKGICTVFGTAAPNRGAVHVQFLRSICDGKWPVISGSEKALIVRRKETRTLGLYIQDCSRAERRSRTVLYRTAYEYCRYTDQTQRPA